MLYYKSIIGNKINCFIKLFFFTVTYVFFQTNSLAQTCSKFMVSQTAPPPFPAQQPNQHLSQNTVNSSQYFDINEALSDSTSGDVICFKTGVYPAIRIINIDGGLSGITLKAEFDSHVEILHSDYKGTGVYIYNSKNITISGLTISGGLYGIYTKGSSDLSFTNNNISNVGQEGITIKSGISKQSLSNFTIANNIITDTGKALPQYGEGIYIGDGNDNFNEIITNVKIENNHLRNTSNEAIDIKINVKNVDIHLNTIIDTNLKFNGAITVATSTRYGSDANISITDNTIRGVTNRLGYRPSGIAIGQGNAYIANNFISEPSSKFIGICLYSTFVNPDANNISIESNNIVTNGVDIYERCTGGTKVNARANATYM